jgi:beta-glucanase (GH16 family)
MKKGLIVTSILIWIIVMVVTITFEQSAVQQQAPYGGRSNMPDARGANSQWKLIFDDEFNGTKLDTTRWMPCYHSGKCTNSGNREQEWYLPDNVSEGNGVLTLRAERKKYRAVDGKTYNYVSGMISSVNFSFTYGYIEMRAKVAAGRGMWSAFWTLPVNGGWPPEIDVQEILGRDPTAMLMNYHYAANNSQNSTTWRGPDFTAGWHTFAVDWEPDAITWYVDGVERKRDTDASTITHEPMYLLANLAVGSSWAGTPDATTVFPATYEIDYIRVWRKQAESTSTLEIIPDDTAVSGIISPV